MIKAIYNLVFTVALLWAVTACSPLVVLDESDDGGTTNVSASANATVVIELVGNPSTGYEWFQQNPDPALPATRTYESGSPPDGAPGLYSFTLTPAPHNKGNSYLIEILYYRSWEGPEQAIDSFAHTLEVR